MRGWLLPVLGRVDEAWAVAVPAGERLRELGHSDASGVLAEIAILAADHEAAARIPRCPRCKSELPWLVEADAETFDAETSALVPVVVDFWAAWCGPCRMMSPVLEDLAGRHAGRLKVVKVDVDANPGLAGRFGAQSIPLLVVIRDGREVDGIVGALPRAALEQRLAPTLAS
jgi:thioredoxin 2